MHKKKTTGICIILMLLFLVSTASAKTLKIGMMGPLTGPYASDGSDIKNGALTAIAVFQEAGGIAGYDKIELFPQDTACDPRQAVAAANKLVNLEVVGVVGAYCSSSTIPASEVLDEEDIVMITPGSTNEKVTERGLKYMFRMCGRDDDQAPLAAKFLQSALGAKTLFVLDDKTTYSQGVADGVAKAAKALGMKVLAHEHVNQGEKDFSAILTRAKQANPDVLYMSLQGYSPAALMAIQAKRLGVKATMVSPDTAFNPKLMEVAKKASEGMYMTFGYSDPSTPEYKAFEKRYVPQYGTIAAYSAYSYDSTITLLTAIKNAGSTDPDKIRAQILKLDFQGVSKHVRFTENGDSGSNYIALKVENGKIIPYWDPQKGVMKN